MKWRPHLLLWDCPVLGLGRRNMIGVRVVGKRRVFGRGTKHMFLWLCFGRMRYAGVGELGGGMIIL